MGNDHSISSVFHMKWICTPDPSWGLITRGNRWADAPSRNTPDPSWGTITQGSAERAHGQQHLLTPHGERSLCLREPGPRWRQTPDPSWGTITRWLWLTPGRRGPSPDPSW